MPDADVNTIQGQAMTEAMALAMEQLGFGVLVKELNSGRYVRANAAAQAMLGLQGREVVGATDADLFDADLALAWRAADLQAQASAAGVRAEHKVAIAGVRRELLTWRQVVGEGEQRVMLSVWQDLTELRKRDGQLASALTQLEQQQTAMETLRRDMQDNQVRDTVSGLYHRAHFEEQLRREADLSAREQREFALVAVAIDNLDDILRLHGPEGGERVVEALGRLLRAGTRAMDSPCRLGGDRFVVLLSGVGLATAHSRMEQLRRQCSQHIVPYNGQQIPFTVSMGVASFPHTAGAIDDLMRSADRALSSARDKGGNHIVLASIQFAPVA